MTHHETIHDGFELAPEGTLHVPEVIGIFPLPRTVLLPGGGGLFFQLRW